MIIYFTAKQRKKRFISPRMNANRRKLKNNKKFLFAFLALICGKIVFS